MVSGAVLRIVSIGVLMLVIGVAGCNKGKVTTNKKGSPESSEKATERSRKVDVPGKRDAAGSSGRDLILLDEEVVEDPYEDEPEVPLPTVVPENREKSLRDKLKKLKFKARRDLLWARAAISNRQSYERSLDKFDRNAEEWDMYQRVPLAPKLEEAEANLRELATRVGVEIAFFQMELQTGEQRQLPMVIHGEKSFEFRDSDLRGMAQIVLRLSLAGAGNLLEFIRGTKELPRLFTIRRVIRTPQGIVINGDVCYFREEKFPLHVVKERSLEQSMKNFGIEVSAREAVRQDPVGHLQNASLSYKEFNASLPLLNEAMALLSESKFKSARSEFFRRASQGAARSASEWERKAVEYRWTR